MSYLGHIAREHFEGRRWHPLITALFWDFAEVKRTANFKSLREDILRDAHVQFPEQLARILCNRRSCGALLKRLQQEAQDLRWTGLWEERRKRGEVPPKGEVS